MSRPAVVQATFEDFKLIKTRGVAQLVFEVPAELADIALHTLGGLPKAALQVNVAIARIRHPNQEAHMEDTDQPTKSPAQIAKDAMTQCAIACKGEAFQRWMLGPEFRTDNKSGNEMMASAQVRRELGIKSRTEIRDNPEKLAEWNAMWRRFEAETIPAAA